MEKNDIITRIDEFRNLVSNREYEKATEVADELDLKKIKDNNFLSLVADVYELMRMYDKSKKVLLIAYENTNAGRNLAYRLCLASVKTKDFEDAKEFYEDFVEMAPRDTGRYILQYKMAKGQNASPEKLIEILEEYVNIDMEEKWAYQLAKLYHMVGDEEKCIDMCDEVSLWFSEGKYVLKAMELKKMYQPLTASQQQKYDKAVEKQNQLKLNKNVNETVEETVEATEPESDVAENIPEESADTVQEVENSDESVWFDEEDEIKEVDDISVFPDIQVNEEDSSRFNTMDMHEVIAHGMMEIEAEAQEEQPEESQEPESDDKMEMELPEPEEVVINDVNDVQNILRELQERGILKADTVDKVVDIIGGDVSSDNNESVAPVQEEIEDNGQQTEIDLSNEQEIDLEETFEEKATEAVEESKESLVDSINDSLGLTKEFGTKLTETPKDILEQPTCAIPDVKEFAKPKDVVEASVPTNNVPVFDLSFNEIQPPTGVKVDESLEETTKEETNEVTEAVEDSKETTETVVSENKIVLTDEELTAFKNYVNVEGFESNIKEVLTALITDFEPNGKSDVGNVMILGDEKTGKTTLAIELIKLVNKKRGRRGRRLAKVDGVALNGRSFRKSLNRLIGSDLIIENANVLGAMTISEIIDVCGMYTDDMLIVLEGDGDGMDILVKNTPRISDVFNHVVRIREYDIKEWVDYGIGYAHEKGYVFDELGNLAFYKVIDDFFGEHKGIGQSEVEQIVDDAIVKASKKLFGNKKNEDGYHILVEKDFNI